MFFLARAALCIGLVAFMLPPSDKARNWGGLADRLGSICSGSPQDCVEARLAALALANVVASEFAENAPRSSMSTLLPSDLVPVWRGRALGS